MTKQESFTSSMQSGNRMTGRAGRLAIALVLSSSLGVAAQDTTKAADKATSANATTDSATTNSGTHEKVINGYAIHQTVELGGHIANHSGSGAMWDTLVNLQSGPRILSHSLTMRTVNARKTPFFDDLTTSSFGYGGDPNNVTRLRFSKGKLYQLDGSFRRDRQYFDYDLLDNPLIPASAYPYVPVLTSPHRFNTVRRMTDVDMTILPLSLVSVRFGYSKNTAEGPTFSTVHTATDALLSQWWRNSTDQLTGGIDWKPTSKTIFSYDQFVTIYKGDTTWKLTGLNYQIADGTPVSLGIDIFTGPAASSTCVVAGTANNAVPTVRSTCSGTLGYQRSSPTRTLFPTEQMRFSTSELQHVTMNGHLLYSGATGSVDQYNELFTGWLSRTGQSQIVDAGSGTKGKFASLKRVSVAADYGVTVELTPQISVSDIFDFSAVRSPASNSYTEASLYASSLASKQPATPYYSASSGADSTSNQNTKFLGQNIKSNTISAAWAAKPTFKLSLGYRYRDRSILIASGNTLISTYNPRSVLKTATGCPNNSSTCTVEVDTPTTSNATPIHEHWGLFGLYLQPSIKLRINANVDAMYADNSFTEISPRQIQHYRVSTSYKASQWVNLSGTVNLLEGRNNVALVHHLEHARDYSIGAVVSPSEKWSLDLNYAYDDVFSQTDECYVVQAVAALGLTVPAGLPACNDSTKLAAGLLYLGTGYYDAPTQYGSISFMLAPVKRVHFNGGYRMSAVDGHELLLNSRQVPGSLQSQYQSPFGNLAVDIAPNWTWKADYNYYSYGEGSPIGPTAPRSFRGNVFTLGVRYAF